MRKLGVTYLLAILCNWVNAQQLHHQHYTVNEGMPSSQVYDIIQDDKGYLWFATDRGVCRFNGYRFESFGLLDGLTDNTVFQFFQHSSGEIWCSTLNNRLFRFNSDAKFTPYQNNHLFDGFPVNAVITDIYVDEEETIYLGFLNRTGYATITKEGEASLNLEKAIPNRYIVNNIGNNGNSLGYSLEHLDDQPPPLSKETNSILSENSFFYKTEAIGNQSIFIDMNNAYLCGNGETMVLDTNILPVELGVFDENHFWIGCRYGGARIYNKQGELVKTILNGKSVTCLYYDHEGGLWASTLNSGVYYFKNTELISHRFSNEKEYVKNITVDDQGAIYSGYYNGKVLKWSNDQFEIMYESADNMPAQVQYYDQLNDVLVAASKTLFLLDRPDSTFIHRGVLKFSDDAKKQPLIGHYGGYGIYEDNQMKDINVKLRVHDIAPSDSGFYFASTRGLFHYQNNVLDTLGRIHPLLEYRIDDIDQSGEFWYLGSQGVGIIVYSEDTVYNIGREQGLYSNHCTEVYAENDTIVWACTNAGLNRIVFTNSGYQVNGLSSIDGLINNEVTDVEVVGNTVWVGTREGLCSFPKSMLEHEHSEYPDYYLSLTGLLVNDQQQSDNMLSDLDYYQNRLEFSYLAISFKNNYKLEYRYRLKGLEKDWNYTNNLSITYPSIPPGEYTFELQVRGENQPWNDNQLGIPIQIHPPFYSTWWFLISINALGLVIIYLFFRFRILSYNREIIRELLRQVVKRLKRSSYIVFREHGKEVRVESSEVLYIKAAGNYLEVYTTDSKHMIRCKISEFLKMVPDQMEYLRVHRSYIVRIDKIKKKSNKSIEINGTEIPVGESYKNEIQKILF